MLIDRSHERLISIRVAWTKVPGVVRRFPFATVRISLARSVRCCKIMELGSLEARPRWIDFASIRSEVKTFQFSFEISTLVLIGQVIFFFRVAWIQVTTRLIWTRPKGVYAPAEQRCLRTVFANSAREMFANILWPLYDLLANSKFSKPGKNVLYINFVSFSLSLSLYIYIYISYSLEIQLLDNISDKWTTNGFANANGNARLKGEGW